MQMSAEQAEKILYVGTCAGENPEKAAMPFVMANAAMAMDIQATVCLQGNGVYLAYKGYTEKMMRPGGFPPIQQLLKQFLELGGKLLVCVPCIKERNIEESELVDGAQTTAAGVLNIEATESKAVFVY
jgi:predicted peroxiredoxin